MTNTRNNTPHLFLRLLVTAAAFLITPLHAGESPQGLTVRIVGVHDGDSITALTADLTQIKVRLLGIDAPELGQPFGRAAKQFLSDAVFGREVRLIVTGTDRYRRTLAIVMHDGVNVNQAIVEAGLAWHFKRYSRDARLADLETEAQDARRGLWADNDPTPPWQWRKH